MRSLTVPEWGSVFLGNPVGGASRTYRPGPDDYSRWLGYLHCSPTAPTILEATESAVEFFHIEQDLALIVPRNEWAEFFYSLKNGFVAPNCPAQFIYFARAAFAQYRICNLIGPMLPKEASFLACKQDYFGAGYTPHDAICNFVCSQFQPITLEHPIVRCGDWYEAHITSTDMVAALPLELGASLTADDVRNISLVPGMGLCIGGTPLSALPGAKGVTNSIYDLR